MMKNNKIGLIVQARMSSTRLPGKVMKLVMGKSLLEHLIDRLKKVSSVDEIIIATTVKPVDDIIVETARRLGVKVFRGSENDVLERYYLAAKEFGLDTVVRVTSDCPVMDPEVVDKCIAFFIDKQPVDYISNCLKRTFPVGLDVEVFSFAALERAYKEAKDEAEREHVAPYMYRHPEIFKLDFLANETDCSSFRWTVDTKEDLELIEEIYKRLYHVGQLFGFKELIDLFQREPELKRINEKVHQKKVGEK